MKRTALLVIDCQSFFHPMLISSTHPVIPNILRLCAHFRFLDLPRIFTQHGHTTSELKPPYRNQLVAKWGPNGSIHVGSKKWALIDELKEEAEGKSTLDGESQDEERHLSGVGTEGDVIMMGKNTYDAFINTALADVLEQKKVERVVVVGVMTDCCVDTTARSAFNRGFETWVVSDACASADETQHEAGLRGFEFGFGEVLETKEVLKRLS